MILRESPADTAPIAATSAQQRWLFASLLLWGIGVQSLEAVATAGFVFTTLGTLVVVWPRRSLDGIRTKLIAWWPLTAFIAWALVMPVVGGHLPDGAGVGRLADWLGLPAAFVAVRAITPRQRTQLGIVIAAIFVASCVMAGFQHLGWWPAPEAFRGWRWTGLPFNRVYEEIADAPGRFMAGGLLFHRLKFAHVGGLIVAGAFFMGSLLSGRTRALLWGLAAFGLLSILIFSYARAAALSILATGALLLFFARPQLNRILAGGAAFGASLGGVFLLAPGLWKRFTLIFDSGSNGDRTQLWGAGLRAVRHSPVAGVGLGRFRLADFATDHTPKHILEHGGKSHNQFLSFAAELGIPGSLLFIVLLVWIGWRLRGPTGRPGLAVLLFFVALALVHDPLFHAPFSMGLVLALGAALAMVESPPASASSR